MRYNLFWYNYIKSTLKASLQCSPLRVFYSLSTKLVYICYNPTNTSPSTSLQCAKERVFFMTLLTPLKINILKSIKLPRSHRPETVQEPHFSRNRDLSPVKNVPFHETLGLKSKLHNWKISTSCTVFGAMGTRENNNIKTTVGRGVPTPTNIDRKQIYQKTKIICMKIFMVCCNVLVDSIDVGMRATRPTEATYV